jgi:molecular chaperone DnaK (HSP70)
VRGVDPMTAVAEGAAIAAAILEGQYDGDFFVTTEHALGTAVLDQSGQLQFSTILKRNVKLPATQREQFFPVVDNQESVRLQVWEGDEDKALGDEDNVLLAEWEVSLVPRMRGEARIDLEYSYDVNGLLHVKATDAVDDRALFEGDVQAMSGREPQALVEIAKKVGTTLDLASHSGGTTSHLAAPPDLPPEVRASLDRARVKVIPFIPDDEARVVEELAQELETAASSGDDSEAARDALNDALRRYAYLF